jgi:hypothetical protein
MIAAACRMLPRNHKRQFGSATQIRIRGSAEFRKCSAFGPVPDGLFFKQQGSSISLRPHSPFLPYWRCRRDSWKTGKYQYVMVPIYGQPVQSCFARYTRVWKEQPMKKVASVLILCLSTLCLSACAILNRDAGPCYGMGCPATAPKSAPAQQVTAKSAGHPKTHGERLTKDVADPASQAKRGE